VTKDGPLLLNISAVLSLAAKKVYFIFMNNENNLLNQFQS